MEKKLNINKMTIADAMKNITSGKFVIPSFQRDYVWEMKQIEKLWDSILQGFPISTFLLWHLDKNITSESMYFCKFKSEFTFKSSKKSDLTENSYGCETIDLKTSDTAVLDGQQRLSSIYMTLCGETYIKPKYAHSDKNIAKLFIQLDKNKVENDDTYDEKIYDIFYTSKIANADHSLFEIRKIFTKEFSDDSLREKTIEKYLTFVSPNSRTYAYNILTTLYKKVYKEQLITYTEIFNMSSDDALEMFIRFNNGGKPLSKSEITKSILKNYWPEAPDKIDRLLSGEFYDFGSGFVVRNALMIFDDVTKTKIDNNIVSQLRDNWDLFAKSIKLTGELLKKYKIDVNKKFKSSWSILCPIVYSIYMNNGKIVGEDALMAYLYRAIFFTFYSSATTAKLARMRQLIDNCYSNNEYKLTIDAIDSQIRELKATDAKLYELMSYQKGSNVAGEVLYYLSKDWLEQYVAYDQDHIHAKERFELGVPAGVSPIKWKEWARLANTLPNLHYLDKDPNRGSKNAKSLLIYLSSLLPEAKTLFIKRAMIPDGVSLDERDFDKFYQKRMELLISRIRELIKY